MGSKSMTPSSRIQDATLELLKHLRQSWMKKHGIPVPPPPLAAKQKAEIRECFDMMDTDGSGAIDVGEIVDAFSAIGVSVSKAALERIMREIDPDKSGEIEFDEFLSIMGRAITENASTGGGGLGVGVDRADGEEGGSSLGFAEAVLAFRRKKLIEALEEGGEARAKVVAYHELMQDLVAEELRTLKVRVQAREAMEWKMSQRASAAAARTSASGGALSSRGSKARDKLRGIITTATRQASGQLGSDNSGELSRSASHAMVLFSAGDDDSGSCGGGAGLGAVDEGEGEGGLGLGVAVPSASVPQKRFTAVMSHLKTAVMSGDVGRMTPAPADHPPHGGPAGLAGSMGLARMRSVRVHSPFGDAGSSDEEEWGGRLSAQASALSLVRPLGGTVLGGEGSGAGEGEECGSHGAGALSADWGSISALQAHKARLLKMSPEERANAPTYARKRHRVHTWGPPGRVAARVRSAAHSFFTHLDRTVKQKEAKQRKAPACMAAPRSTPTPIGEEFYALCSRPASCIYAPRTSTRWSVSGGMASRPGSVSALTPGGASSASPTPSGPPPFVVTSPHSSRVLSPSPSGGPGHHRSSSRGSCRGAGSGERGMQRQRSLNAVSQLQAACRPATAAATITTITVATPASAGMTPAHKPPSPDPHQQSASVEEDAIVALGLAPSSRIGHPAPNLPPALVPAPSPASPPSPAVPAVPAAAGASAGAGEEADDEVARILMPPLPSHGTLDTRGTYPLNHIRGDAAQRGEEGWGLASGAGGPPSGATQHAQWQEMAGGSADVSEGEEGGVTDSDRPAKPRMLYSTTPEGTTPGVSPSPPPDPLPATQRPLHRPPPHDPRQHHRDRALTVWANSLRETMHANVTTLGGPPRSASPDVAPPPRSPRIGGGAQAAAGAVPPSGDASEAPPSSPRPPFLAGGAKTMFKGGLFGTTQPVPPSHRRGGPLSQSMPDTLRHAVQRASSAMLADGYDRQRKRDSPSPPSGRLSSRSPVPGRDRLGVSVGGARSVVGASTVGVSVNANSGPPFLGSAYFGPRPSTTSGLTRARNVATSPPQSAAGARGAGKSRGGTSPSWHQLLLAGSAASVAAAGAGRGNPPLPPSLPQRPSTCMASIGSALVPTSHRQLRASCPSTAGGTSPVGQPLPTPQEQHAPGKAAQYLPAHHRPAVAPSPREEAHAWSHRARMYVHTHSVGGAAAQLVGHIQSYTPIFALPAPSLTDPEVMAINGLRTHQHTEGREGDGGARMGADLAIPMASAGAGGASRPGRAQRATSAPLSAPQLHQPAQPPRHGGLPLSPRSAPEGMVVATRMRMLGAKPAKPIKSATTASRHSGEGGVAASARASAAALPSQPARLTSPVHPLTSPGQAAITLAVNRTMESKWRAEHPDRPAASAAATATAAPRTWNMSRLPVSAPIKALPRTGADAAPGSKGAAPLGGKLRVAVGEAGAASAAAPPSPSPWASGPMPPVSPGFIAAGGDAVGGSGGGGGEEAGGLEGEASSHPSTPTRLLLGSKISGR